METAIKYEGYLRQQDREVEKLRKAESRRIPDDLDYAMPGLSREIVEKLSRVRPHRSRRPAAYPESRRHRFPFSCSTSRCVDFQILLKASRSLFRGWLIVEQELARVGVPVSKRSPRKTGSLLR